MNERVSSNSKSSKKERHSTKRSKVKDKINEYLKYLNRKRGYWESWKVEKAMEPDEDGGGVVEGEVEGVAEAVGSTLNASK